MNSYERIANVTITIAMDEYRVINGESEWCQSTALFTETVDSIIASDIAIALKLATDHVRELNEAAKMLDTVPSSGTDVKWSTRFHVSVGTAEEGSSTKRWWEAKDLSADDFGRDED